MKLNHCLLTKPSSPAGTGRRATGWGILLLCFVQLKTYSQSYLFDTLMHRIRADLQTGALTALDKQVAADIHTLRNDSSWADVHYNNDNSFHLDRVVNMVKAYTTAGSRYYGDTALYRRIVNTLSFWYSKNPKNTNWWHNDISYPQHIGQALIMMRNAPTPLPVVLEQQLVQRMIRKLKTGDGANTSDEALHYLYRACLTHNKATLDSAARYLFEPIAIAAGGEGLQFDNSYFQHGSQQAIASYGKVFLANSYNAAYYLRGTPYALPAVQQSMLSAFLRYTFLRGIRGNFYDFNIRGRGISRKDSLLSGLTGLLQKVAQVDASCTSCWEAGRKRIAGQVPPSYQVAPLHTHYWKSNYTLHTQPAYTFSVQTASVRTLRTERGNNENILGKFLPDGATNIQRRGPEYANCMPLWEWDKIPGVTNRDYSTDEGCTITKEWGQPGTTAFAGGVSDSLYGATAYLQDYDSVQARKAWFFFKEEVVCLGAGISSRAAEPVTTTLNQCWLNGPVLAASAAILTPVQDDAVTILHNPSWILHDSIGYVFPQPCELRIDNRLQQGSWYHINHFQSPDTVKGKLFKLWMLHGAQPAKARYAYIVVPGKSRHGMQSYNSSVIRILQNSDSLQAVWHSGLNRLMLVFYTPGSIRTPVATIRVNQPCLVYLDNSKQTAPALYLAEPTQLLQEIRLDITLAGKRRAQQYIVPLPRQPYAGSTVRVPLDNR